MNIDYEKLAKFLTELHVHKHLESDYILESRNLKSAFFLMEEIDPSKVEEQTKTVKQQLLQLIKLFPADKAANLIKELQVLINAIPEGAKISSIIANPEFSDDSSSKKTAKDYDVKIMLATNGAARVVNAITVISTAMKPFTDKMDENVVKETTIGELSEKAKAEADFKDKFIDPARLQAGLNKAFVPAASLKASFQRGSKAASDSAAASGAKTGLGKLFAKAATFVAGFSTAPATQLYPKLLKAFTEFLMASTPAELYQLAEKMKTDGTKITVKSTENASASSSSVAAAAGGAKVGDQQESEEEPEEIDDKLKDAANDAAKSKESPAEGISQALDDWSKSLSKSSQEALTSGGKIDKLKTDIQKRLEDEKKNVEEEVTAAVEDWISKNEDSLIKSKKFAKKNFDSLRNIIPKLAAHLSQQVNEGKRSLNSQRIRKIVFSYLDNRFLGSQNPLSESINRWQKMAGIK